MKGLCYMKENKHIEKELLFKNNIKDITSISLDSNYKVEKNKIIGNFIIDGEYKIHEVSINKEKFNFKIPFDYEIDNDIDTESIKVDITNFIYDYKKDELIVNIDYEITGDKKSILLFDNEESLDEFLSKREIEVVDTRNSEIEDKKDKEERKSIDKIEDKELVDNKQELSLEDTREIKNESTKSEGENRDNIKSDDIISSINNNTDNFVTYKIYKIHENETLESIVIKYHTTIDDLKEYNDLNNLNIGDKIIVPINE